MQLRQLFALLLMKVNTIHISRNAKSKGMVKDIAWIVEDSSLFKWFSHGNSIHSNGKCFHLRRLIWNSPEPSSPIIFALILMLRIINCCVLYYSFLLCFDYVLTLPFINNNLKIALRIYLTALKILYQNFYQKCHFDIPHPL